MILGNQKVYQKMKLWMKILVVGLLSALLFGCAAVKPYEREKLADPIMDPGGHFSKQTLEQKFFSTREGSMGGGTGVGGGCGCSK